MIFTRYVYLGENTIKFEDALQRYPWQKYSSPEYPIGPVRNQFNREISDNSACSTFCTFQKDVNTSTKSKGINVNCAESRTSDDSSSLQKDTACDSQVHIIPAIGVNSQVANCCQLMSARHEGINVDSYSDHTEKQEVFPCPVKEADSHTVHSSELSSNSDDAGDRCEQPSPFSLAEETNQAEEEDVTEGHVNEDVVEQFANVLMEAVRRRVFNLPRITETCTTSGKLQDNVTDDDKETVVGVGNKTRSNVGILFSGGLDSIVLAALADR